MITTPQQTLPAKVDAPKVGDFEWILPAISTGVACASGAAILGSGIAGPAGAIVGGVSGAAFGFLSRREDEKKKK